jgi:hypothetical protein
MSIRELSFRSQNPIISLPYFRYRLRLDRPVDHNTLSGELGKLAWGLKRQFQLPILSDSTQVAILSPIALDNLCQLPTILAQETIDLADLNYQHFLFQVSNFALYAAFSKANNPPRPEKLQFFLSSQQGVNLDFGEKIFPYPSIALKQGYLLEKPEAIKAFIFYPQSLKSKVIDYLDSQIERLN